MQPDDRQRQWLVVQVATGPRGQLVTTANQVRQAIAADRNVRDRVRVDIPYKNRQWVERGGRTVSLGATGLIGFPEGKTSQQFVFLDGTDFLLGPGRTASGQPFHPLGMVLSYFFFWAITGIGQPGNMVRLMAFRDSRTLRRAIVTVSIYFGMIYLPLVLVVMSARQHLPVLTAEESDRTIVLIATRLVANMSWGYQVIGALLIAAPFAAVMSTVDSFLLMISSSTVRDLYQRTLRPDVSQRAVKAASYAMTVLVGVVVTLIARRPPNFLQHIIVFVGGGFAATFLAPMILGLYWKRATRQGAVSAMAGGFILIVFLSSPPMFGHPTINLLGFHPSVWAIGGSFVLGIAVSLMTGPPPEPLVKRYFFSSPSNQS